VYAHLGCHKQQVHERVGDTSKTALELRRPKAQRERDRQTERKRERDKERKREREKKTESVYLGCHEQKVHEGMCDTSQTALELRRPKAQRDAAGVVASQGLQGKAAWWREGMSEQR
jgi:hypothetical protein